MSNFSISTDEVTIQNRSSTLSLRTTTLNAPIIYTDRIVMADTGKIAIGSGVNTSGNSISLGLNAGDGTDSINIGRGANQYANATNSICIGFASGQSNNQGNNIIIGHQSGTSTAGQESVLIGGTAGFQGSGTGCVAIGPRSSYTPSVSPYNQYSTNIGYFSGYTNQGTKSIAIGALAGYTGQGNSSIAIGYRAGDISQPANSIILNSSGLSLNGSTPNAFYVKTVRTQGTADKIVLTWNPTTSEIYAYDYTATAKTFVIDHPVQNDKYLVHACLEGPEAGVYYRGQSEIVNGESVEVVLPEYVKSFSDFTVQLSPVYNGTKRILHTSRVENGSFTVYGKNGKFVWLVHCLRNAIQVEIDKDQVEIKGNGPYKYVLSN